MPSTEAATPHSSLSERYRVLLEIGRTLTGTLSPEDLYRAIYRETARVLEASGFYISVYDPGRDLATVVFYADRGRERRVQVSYRGSDSEVIRTGEGSLIEDRVRVHSLMLLGEGDSETTRSAITAPLRYKGRVLGAVSTQSYRPRAYRPPDLELLQGIADVAAVAVENARYVAELEHRRLEAERLEEIGRALAASLDPVRVIRQVVEATRELVDAEGASLWLVDEGAVRVAAACGEAGEREGLTWPLEGSLVEEIARGRRPVRIEEAGSSERLPEVLRAATGARCALVVPLIVGHETAGALTAWNARPRSFSDEDAHVGQRLASQAAVALQNARLHERLQALSLTDPLTGLPNRRHLAMHLAKEVAAARRGRMLAVILFDLDEFKRYNDSLGHVAGDEALRAFGRILTSETRAMNLAARYGGDEFISVLADTDLEGSRRLARRIAGRVAADPVLGAHGITVSFGVAGFDPETMDSGECLVRAADDDLYRSKGEREGSPARSGA